MKKNKMMRIASFLLVAVLMSTCAISGTFAKYVTSDDATDSARVAKWGVSVDITTTGLFKESYGTNASPVPKDEGGTDISVSVNGNSEEVVAPGTSGAFTFYITGTPETAVNVNVDFGELTMITLPADKVDSNAIYYPIKWTLKRADTDAATKTDVTGCTNVSLQEIENYFVANSNGLNGNYAANTNLATTFGYYELSWSWAFSTDDATDKLDTYLGNVMAGTITDATVKTTESFALTITVTQID